jgi:hypothetical protein
MKYKPNAHTLRIKKWLRSRLKANRAKASQWLRDRGHNQYGIVHLLHGKDLANLRKEFLGEFSID